MTRRRVVVLASASAMLLLGVLVVALVLAITQSEFGQERVRQYLVSRIAAGMGKRGSMYIGRIHGSLFTGVTVDSFAIRDAEDSLFVATGPVHVRYDPRDLIDKRILLAYLEVDRPVINLRRHADREWNYRRIFPPGPPSAPSAERRFGDYIVIDSTVIHDGTFILTQSWEPPDSLKGARRDSAVKAAYASPEHEIRPTSEGPKQTRRWTHLELRSPFVRIADPDSAGRLIAVGAMSAVESDPPFRFSNVRGPVRIVGDSVWLELRHFDLPASTGHATGKVWWGGDAPVQYDVHVVGDSVSLADIAWVYPTLPTTGGGRMDLTIRNDPRDANVLDYAIRRMDVKSTGSRLRGAMTFGIGGPVLVVKDVDLAAEPVDFDLLRTLNGGAFPVDWRGQFTGTVRARGGPVNRWQVDDARLTFRDGHVPGAVSSLTAHGGLDILHIGLATFRGLAVNVRQLDLRTPRFLFPSFPRLRGVVRGTATLDSVWTDLRFRNADLSLADGPGPPSHFTGRGRVTYGERMAFDVDVAASPISFTTLARSYPGLRLRGTYTGPLRAAGTVGDFTLATTLTGAAGQIAVDGRFDAESPGMAARGTASVKDLDVRTLFDDTTLVSTRLTGRADGEVRGDSLTNLEGSARIALDRSRVDLLRIDPSVAAIAFGNGRVQVDSLRLESAAARVTASGALGIAPGVRDTLRFVVDVDSLGGLRPYLAPPPSRRGAAELARQDSTTPAAARAQLEQAIRDSLDGTLRAQGVLVGSIDTLDAAGTVTGRELFAGGDYARRLEGAFAFQRLPHTPVGTAHAALDSILVAGVRLDSAAATVIVRDRATATLALTAASPAGPGAYHASAALDVHRDVDSMVVTVDSARLALADHAWTLAMPAHVRFDSTGTTVDSVVVRSRAARVAVAGTFPMREPVRGTLTVDSLPLADLSAVVQTTRPLSGTATLSGSIAGLRANPTIQVSGSFTGLQYGDVAFPYFAARADYADRRLRAAVDVYRDGKRVLTANGTFPVDLSLLPVPDRLLPDSLRGQVRADSVDLGILEAMSPQFSQVTGTASTVVDIGGTWRQPLLVGRIGLHDADIGLPAAGIRLRRVNADIALTADSVRIASLSMMSGSEPNSTLGVQGVIRVPNWRDMRDIGFDVAMHARHFQALDKRALARIELSGDVRLSGTVRRPELGGDLTVDRGTLYISELSPKKVIDLNDPDFYDIVDTSLVANRQLIRSAYLDTLIANLRVPGLDVHIGDDVWLRSQEANIKLAGDVELQKVGSQRLESGTLRVSRGTYRLNLGLVLRTFQVDSGSVVFFGDPNIPPALDIWATYTVRQANRESGQDVRIIAHIGGTLLDPRLALSSDERIPLSDTEIMSYLVFGQPTAATTSDVANNAALRPVAAALLPSVGGVLERALADQISFIDYVQVQTGSVGQQDVFTNTGASSVLSGTRIGVGKQIGERTFVTVNAGLCGLAGTQGSASFAESFGITVDYRLNDGFSLQASSEPSTQALQCRPGLTLLGNRPRQYGFDLFREWSF